MPKIGSQRAFLITKI